ncbi:MAG TPA: hypothetical protein PK156_45545, partial [Polyangium sp.]|nr:hypothetical protein [Polyangium sp.]
MMHESMSAWLGEVEIDASLLRAHPLIVGVEGDPGEDLPRFRRNLLQLVMGKTDWSDAVNHYLARGDYSRACRMLQSVSPDQKLAVGEDIERVWQAKVTECAQRVDAARKRNNELRSAGLSVIQADEWLGLADDALRALPRGRGDALFAALGTSSKQVLGDLQGYLDEIDAVSRSGFAELERQRQELQQKVLEHYQHITRRIPELMIRGELTQAQIVAIGEIQSALVPMLQRQDLQGIEQLRTALTQVEHGTPVTSLPRRNIEGPPQVAAGLRRLPDKRRLGFADLSQWVQERLRGLRTSDSNMSIPSAESLLDEAIRSADTAQLEKTVRKSMVLWEKEPETSQVALGAALIAEAKRQLFENDVEAGLTFFLDAFRWNTSLTLDPLRAERARETSAWGILLALVIPRLSAQERRDVLVPANIMTLFRRKIGDLPLSRVNELQLFGQLAHVVLRMGLPSAQIFVEEFLLSFFKGRPIATAEFASGLILENVGSWTIPIVLLAHIFDETERSLGAKAGLLALVGDSADGSAKMEAKHDAELLERLRRRIVSLAESSDLARSVEQAIGVTEHRSGILDSDVVSVLGCRLVTSLLQLRPGERLVIELHNRNKARAIRYVRASLTLQDATGRVLAKAFAGPDIVPQIGPEERQEVVFQLQRTDDEILRASKIEMRFSQRDVSGKDFYIASNHRRFSLKIVAPTAANKPKNPYVVGRAVQDLDQIYGRDEQIAKICRALIGEKQDNTVLILGERRMGKTTVLNAVQAHQDIKERFGDRVIRLDVEDVPSNELASNFFRNRFIDKIAAQVIPYGIRVPDVNETRLKQNPFQTFKDFMEDLDGALGKRHALIIIDELEKL